MRDANVVVGHPNFWRDVRAQSGRRVPRWWWIWVGRWAWLLVGVRDGECVCLLYPKRAGLQVLGESESVGSVIIARSKS